MKFEKLARELLGTGKTVEISQDCASWSKRGGYADSKMMKIQSKLAKHGFKRFNPVCAGTPDGSTMTNGVAFASPDGEIKVVISESYGRTADSNRFSVKMSNVLWGE